jgi:pyruvate kinase
MRRRRRTRIVATLGPASSDAETLHKLFVAGADVFRINMSHTSHERMYELVRTIRAAEVEFGRPIAILADLQGPKLRLGPFAGGKANLAAGASFTLDSADETGDASRVKLPHPEILEALQVGDALLLDDGKVRLVATEVFPDRAVTKVVVGGDISDRKGVSVPDTTIAVSAMTAKDRSDLEAALHAGADWIAVSFVQRPEDIAEVKKVARGRAGVMAKIEKPQGVVRLDEIMDYADAIMVARGDLGVEMPLESCPARRSGSRGCAGASASPSWSRRRCSSR